MANLKLKCKVCGSEFLFTDGEQKFYSQKGYNVPKKCPNCRGGKKFVSGRTCLDVLADLHKNDQISYGDLMDFTRSIRFDNGVNANLLKEIGNMHRNDQISYGDLMDFIRIVIVNKYSGDIPSKLRSYRNMHRNDQISYGDLMDFIRKELHK
jgi:hypothetical protein